MDAKVDQLLHYREELCLEETLPNSSQVFFKISYVVMTIPWS